MKTPKHITTLNVWRIGLTAALLIVTVYVLQTHWSTVRSGLRVAGHAHFGWLLLACLCLLLTYGLAAAIYGRLALHRLRYAQTILIEVATAFVNRLVPSGLGGLGLHGLYLYRRKHTVAEATAIVSVNNILGIAVHVCVLVLLIILYPAVVRDVRVGTINVSWQPIFVATLVVLFIVLLLPIRDRVLSFGRNLLASLRRTRPLRLLQATALAALLTFAYTGVLICTAQSVGVSLGIPKTFIVFSIGMLIGNATPTPGGLVGAEAGLFAGFVGYGVADTDATAAVVLFRLMSYWLPLLPGAAALWLARARKLV